MIQTLKEISTNSQVTCFQQSFNKLFCGFADGTLGIIDIDTGQIDSSTSGHSMGINDICLDAYDQYIYTASDDGHIRIWDRSLNMISDLIGHTDYIQRLKIDPRNLLLLSGSEDCSVILWDLRNLVSVNKFYRVHQSSISALDFSPDSSVFLTASLDGTLHIWDTVSLNSIRTLSKSRKAPISNACFLANGKYILSSCLDSVIYLWEPERVKSLPIREYSGHLNRYYKCPMWVVDSKCMAGTDDGHICAWDLDSSDLETYEHLVDGFIHTVSHSDNSLIYSYIGKSGNPNPITISCINPNN